VQGNFVQGRIHWWESNRAVPRLLSGIEAGVFGGIAMLAWLICGTLWRSDPWWMPLNLLGSTFYGVSALSFWHGRAALAGGALHIFMTGSIGGTFGLLCGGARPGRRMVLLGTLAGLIWQGLANTILWGRINPLVPLYSPQPATLFSYALFGACLGYLGGHPGREFRALRKEASGEPDGVE
jgi:hypothetical protein